MDYLSVFDHKTGRRLAFLEKAYKIGYKKVLNALWSAQFTLPADDWKNSFCEPFNWVEIYDSGKYIGLFRIVPTESIKDSNTREVTYRCEHVLATLLDDVLLGWHEIGNRGIYTNQVIQYILDKQASRNWVLDVCDFNHQYLYGWENENLLSALFSVPNPFVESYKWAFETSRRPWTLSLQKTVPSSSAGTKVRFEIRYAKNMLGIRKSVDAANVCTRLYPLGYGEGENQLGISNVNPTGKKYIDAETQSKYGIISKIWVDRRYQNEESLYQAAVAILDNLKDPVVSYTIDTAHIGSLCEAEVGDIVRVIDDEDGTSTYKQIQSIEKKDVTGDPTSVSIILGVAGNNLESSVADLNDRQRIEETYAQGAVTLYSQSFRDNASNEEPAEIRFYIPDNVVHINQILLEGKLAAFRGYTKATKGGGAASSTTTNGGGTTETTTSGGAHTVTSSNGGATTVTSDSGGGVTATSSSGGSSRATSTSGGSSVITSDAGGGSNVTSSNGGNSTVTSTSGGGDLVTSYDGGGASTTSDYGGGTWQTSEEAGGSYRSTADGGYNVKNTYSEYPTETGFTEYASGSGDHRHWIGLHHHVFELDDHHHDISIPDHSHSIYVPDHYHDVWIPDHSHDVQIPSHSHQVSIPSHYHKVQIPSHSHSVRIGSHSHEVEIPSHTHSVKIPSHTHSLTISGHAHSISIPDHSHRVTIEAHSHGFSIPDHTHAIEYGIYKGTTAQSAVVSCDGTNIGRFQSISGLNLIPYLKKGNDGKVIRGWHSIVVTPNALTRIELDLVIQLFANSRGGGQY